MILLFELPIWFYDFGIDLQVFKSKLDKQNINLIIDLNSQEAKTEIDKRIDILSKVLTYKNGNYDYVASELSDDVKQHFLFRIISSQSNVCRQWFVNRETYLFKHRFKFIRNGLLKYEILKYFLKDSVQKINDVNDLNAIIPNCTSENKIKSIQIEIDKYKRIGTDKIVAVKWYYVPRLLSERRSDLLGIGNGWCITTTEELKDCLGLMFKNHIEQSIKSLQESTHQQSEIKELVNYIEDKIQKKSGIILTLEDTEKFMDTFPLCIIGLIHLMKSGKDLSYTECLQLGLFLKEAGLTLNDYRMFWYLYHPANKGIDFSTFLNNWEYHSDHIYGKQGSMVDYTAMGCLKSRSEGFCPFTEGNKKIALDLIKLYYNQKIDQDILNQHLTAIRRVLVKNPNMACTIELKLRLNSDEPLPVVSHPIDGYYQRFVSQLSQNERMKKEK